MGGVSGRNSDGSQFSVGNSGVMLPVSAPLLRWLISHLCHYDDVVISSQNIPQNNLKTIPDRKRFGRKSYSSYIDINGIAILWIKSIKLTSKTQNKVTHQTVVEM